MPTAGWNGKFMAVGNGGWAGAIAYPQMAPALARGYATASTDTGHEGTNGDASFALGHPEKVIDFGYRAVHEMTVKAKAIVASYYDSSPKRSYWNGCSTGGRQGLKEAQRFPSDFDGIVVGAPGNDLTHSQAQFIWVAQAVHKDEASYIPPSKYSIIHDAVLQACDGRDGVKDGFLEDPTRCTFDPQVLECSGADGPSCLTAAQVITARMVYSPATNPRTKQQIYPGLVPGSELGWAAQAGPQLGAIPNGLFRLRGVQRPLVGLQNVQLRQRHGAGRSDRQRDPVSDRSRSERFLRARRKTAAIPWLERQPTLSTQQRQLLSKRFRGHGRREPREGLLSAVHDPGNAPLPRR